MQLNSSSGFWLKRNPVFGIALLVSLSFLVYSWTLQAQDEDEPNQAEAEQEEIFDPYAPTDFFGKIDYWWKKKTGADTATLKRKMILNCSRRHAESCIEIGDEFLESGHLISAEVHFNLACSFGSDPGCKLYDEIQKQRRAKEDNLRSEIKPARKSCLKKRVALSCRSSNFNSQISAHTTSVGMEKK